MDIPSHIKAKRALLQMSQAELAEKLNVSQQVIGFYERGRNKPKADFYKQWFKVFGEDLLSMSETAPNFDVENILESPFAKQIQNQGYTLENAAEKAGISKRELYNYIDKYEKRELNKKIFDFLAIDLNFDEGFIKAYHKRLDDEGLIVTSLNELFSGINEGGYIGPLFTGGHLDSAERIVNSLIASLPTNRYFMLSVDSNFMHPAISAGDQIICEEIQHKFINHPSNFFVYFITTSLDKVYLARVYKQNEDEWILKMDNHPDFITLDPINIVSLKLVRRVVHVKDAAPQMFEIPK